jgi:DNA-binding beta-propeller fold protein YncE
VTRFPASEPSKAQQIEVGYGPHGIAIDSLGNAWVANTLGHPSAREVIALVKDKLKSKVEGFAASESEADRAAQMWIDIYELLVKYPGGTISMVRADDNVWVANSTGHSVTELCGARPENCPPGLKTGDPISPPGGYIGGLQIITDVAINPAGNLWVANNWDRPDEGFKKTPDESLCTRFGGNGALVFFGSAKPVKSPLIGPPSAQ